MPDLHDKVIIVGPDGEEVDVVGGALQTSGGGGGGGGPATIADGADVTEGAIADAVVAAGAAGTVSAKLRRLTTDISAQLTKLAGGLPAALGSGGGLKVDGSGTALPVSGTVTITPSGTQAVSVADGSDVAEGAVADAVVAAGAAGSLSAKLRRVTAQLNGGLPAALGSTTSANSLPVVVASDQAAVASKVADGVDVNAGAIADAAVTAGATGSMSAKLRSISRDIAGLIAQLPATLGAKTSANSLSVVMASDQAPATKTLGTGEKAGSTSASQFATITTQWVKVKAEYDNAGRVYIGISGVTKADGATDTTTGWQLVAGDETPWFPLSNLNALFLICDNAGDDVTYCYLV